MYIENLHHIDDCPSGLTNQIKLTTQERKNEPQCANKCQMAINGTRNSDYESCGPSDIKHET